MFNVDIVLRKIKNNTWDKDAAEDMSKIVDLINNFLIQLWNRKKLLKCKSCENRQIII